MRLVRGCEARREVVLEYIQSKNVERTRSISPLLVALEYQNQIIVMTEKE